MGTWIFIKDYVGLEIYWGEDEESYIICDSSNKHPWALPAIEYTGVINTVSEAEDLIDECYEEYSAHKESNCDATDDYAVALSYRTHLPLHVV